MQTAQEGGLGLNEPGRPRDYGLRVISSGTALKCLVLLEIGPCEAGSNEGALSGSHLRPLLSNYQDPRLETTPLFSRCSGEQAPGARSRMQSRVPLLLSAGGCPRRVIRGDTQTHASSAGNTHGKADTTTGLWPHASFPGIGVEGSVVAGFCAPFP